MLAEGRGTDGPAPFVSVAEDICATTRLRCFDRTESRCKGMVSIKTDAEASGELIRLLLPAREIPGTVSRLPALSIPIGKMERPRCPRINEYPEPFVSGTVRTPSTVDIASKSHTRNHDAMVVSLEPQPPFQIMGRGQEGLHFQLFQPHRVLVSS